jgi:hypothetical protein
MMLTPDPPSDMTFLTMFLATWTYIIAMCGSITTKTIIGLGHILVLFFSPRSKFGNNILFQI